MSSLPPPTPTTTALEPSLLPSASDGLPPTRLGTEHTSLLGLGLAVEQRQPAFGVMTSGKLDGELNGSWGDPPARASPLPPSLGAIQRPSPAVRSASTTAPSSSVNQAPRLETADRPIAAGADAAAVDAAAGGGGWRVSVAADEGAGSRGRARGQLCVYVQCTSFEELQSRAFGFEADRFFCGRDRSAATHNFTLLRTVKEIRETHDKVRPADLPALYRSAPDI